MAQITLGSGESFTVSGSTNTISGTTTGSETVTITGGNNTFTADFNAGGDRVILAGSASQYTVASSGSSIILTGPNGTTVTFPAPNPTLADAANPRVSFQNAGAQQDYVLDSTTTGTFTLTSTTAGSSSQTITTTPTAVSGTGGGTTPPPTGLTVAVAAQNGAEPSTPVTFTFTLSAAQTTATTISVVTQGGTATLGSDFTPASQQITFAAGETVKFLSIAVLDDAVVEGAEALSITVSGLPLAAGSVTTASITDNDIPPVFNLTTGVDSFTGGAGNDRFIGATSNLTFSDTIDGGAGNDAFELSGGGTLDDVQFSNVTAVETVRTNATTINLGREAREAGVANLDTTTTDVRTASNGNTVPGVSLNLLLDQSGDSLPDFNGPLNAVLGSSVVDTVSLNLATSAGSAINTGGTFTFDAANSAAPIDEVVFNNQVNDVRITITSTAAGDGSAVNAGTTTLGATAQSEDANGALVNGVTSFDDEGIRFTGSGTNAQNVVVSTLFDVRDVSGTERGNFSEVIIGTVGANTFTAGAGAAAGLYYNAGSGADTITGAAARDVLVGGAGDDVLSGLGGADVLLAGAGNDTLTGGAGNDTLDGADGNDTFLFGDGEFIVGDTVTGGAGTDTVRITGATVFGDAQFGATKSGVEFLDSRLTGAAAVTLGTNAETAGIRTVFNGDDSVDASAFASGVTFYLGTQPGLPGAVNDTSVTTSGAVTGGAGADTAVVGNGITTLGTITLNNGNDLVEGQYAFRTVANASATISGGSGQDTLNLGGSVLTDSGLTPGGAAVAYTASFGAGFTGFETLRLFQNTQTATVVGNAVAYTITFSSDASVADDVVFTVDGSNLGSVVTARTQGQPDTTLTSTLSFDGSAETAGRFDIDGGSGNDTLIGGGGADDISGGAGNDTLTGGAGNDILNGGAGNDTIGGGAGRDTVTGGAGIDSITLGAGDGVRDLVNVATGEASRNFGTTPETAANFATGTLTAGVLAAGADTIDFGAGLIVENSASITNGVLSNMSSLGGAVDGAGTLVAALQILEQEFRNDEALNTGVIAFNFGGTLHIGKLVSGVGGEVFSDVVALTAVSTATVTGLVDVDGAGAGTALGLSI